MKYCERCGKELVEGASFCVFCGMKIPVETKRDPIPVPVPVEMPAPAPEPVPEILPEVKEEPVPEILPEIKEEPVPEILPEIKEEPVPEIFPEVKAPAPEIFPEAKPAEPVPDPFAQIPRQTPPAQQTPPPYAQVSQPFAQTPQPAQQPYAQAPQKYAPKPQPAPQPFAQAPQQPYASAPQPYTQQPQGAAWQQPAVPSQYDHTDEFSGKDISDNKVVAMVLYLMGTAGLLIALLCQKSEYVTFHIRQALKLTVLEILTWIGAAVLAVLFTLLGGGLASRGYYGGLSLASLGAAAIPLVIASILSTALFVVRIIMFVRVCQGRVIEAPIVRSVKFMK